MTVEKTKQEKVQPQIYVACLASYNSGILHGEWIDATQDVEDIQSAVTEMLKSSPIPHAEEYAIHDYEDFFNIEIREYTSLRTVSAIAGFIAEHGELGALLLDYYANNIDEAKEALEDRYQGAFESVEEFAEDLTRETTEIPQSLENYIDYEAIAHDMDLNGDIITLTGKDGKVHVFWAS